MKVCHVTNWLPGHHKHWGGAEQACYRQIKLMAKKGYESFVIFTKPDYTLKEKDFVFFPVKTLENYFSRISNVIKMIKLGSIPFDMLTFISTYKILKKIKPDIVHLHTFNILSFSVLEAAKTLNIPTVLSIYDYWCFCPVANLFDENWDVCKKYHGFYCARCLKTRFGIKLPQIVIYLSMFFRKNFFNHFLNKVDAFITLSKSSGKILKDYGIEKNRIYTIPLFFSFNDIGLRKSKKIEKNTILYSGWLAPHKGLHILLKAIPEILKKVPDLKLYILGIRANERYFNYIQKLIQKYDLEKHVIWSEKRFFEKEYKDIFQKANLLIVPEQWENMSPVIVVEGMAIEKPIIASKIGGIPEFIKNGKTGYLADPNNPHEFANKIILALKQKKFTEKIGKNARKFIIQFFDENKTMERIINLYENLIFSD